MKILQLCKKFPFPLKDGESIAVTYLSKALNKLDCEISLLSMNTSKHYFDLNDLPSDFDHYQSIDIVEVDNSLKPLDAFGNLFSKASYHVSRFVSKEFESKLIELLSRESFDVIQLETMYLTPYVEVIKKHSDAIVTLRAHNIEYEIWDRITQNTKPLVKKLYLKHLTRKLKDYELKHLNDYDYVVTVSDRDLSQFKKLGYKNGAMASPIGLKLNRYAVPANKIEKDDFCFIGALDWMPNMEGLDWFVKEVMPLVPGSSKLHVAGRNTPKNLFSLNSDRIKIHGEVADAIDFMNQFPVMVVPLFSGSGTRVKILEGMALGKVVITTTQGLEGIPAEHGKHILIADTKEDFAKAIKLAVKDKTLQASIGDNAKSFVASYYDNAVIAQNLIKKYQYLLKKYKTDNISV